MTKKIFFKVLVLSLLTIQLSGQQVLRLGGGFGLGMNMSTSRTTLVANNAQLDLQSALTYSGRLFLETHFHDKLGIETGLGASYSTYYLRSGNNSFRDYLGLNSYFNLYSYKVLLMPFYNFSMDSFGVSFLKVLGGFTIDRNYTTHSLDDFGYQLQTGSRQFFSGNLQFEARLLKKNRTGRNFEFGISYRVPFWNNEALKFTDSSDRVFSFQSATNTLSLNLFYVIGIRRRRPKSENIQPGPKHEVGRLVE